MLHIMISKRKFFMPAEVTVDFLSWQWVFWTPMKKKEATLSLIHKPNTVFAAIQQFNYLDFYS